MDGGWLRIERVGRGYVGRLHEGPQGGKCRVFEGPLEYKGRLDANVSRALYATRKNTSFGQRLHWGARDAKEVVTFVAWLVFAVGLLAVACWDWASEFRRAW